MPKFIVVKAILFFTFWQAVMLLILEKAGAFSAVDLEGSSFDDYPEFASIFEVRIVYAEWTDMSINANFVTTYALGVPS